MSGEKPGWDKLYLDLTRMGDYHAEKGKVIKNLGILNLPADSKILDIGCATGDLFIMLRDNNFINLFGAEPFYNLAKEAKSKANVAVSDGRYLSYKSGSLDAVMIISSLHHLKPMSEVKKCVVEAKRVLKDTGGLFIVDHHCGMVLRLGLKVIYSPFVHFFPYYKQMKKVIDQESDLFFHWLENYKILFEILDDLGFIIQTYKTDFTVMYIKAELNKSV